MNVSEDKKALDQEIGTRIRIAREAAGLTQERLAELVDVKTQHISDIERGKKGTTVQSLKRICNELHITSDYLIFGKKEDEQPLLVERVKSLNELEQSVAERAMNLALETLHLGATGVKKDN